MAIQAAHYAETEKRLADDPIVVALAADVIAGVAQGSVSLDMFRHDSGTPRHGFMGNANAEYRRRGGTDGGHIGAVANAILAVVDDFIAKDK